VLPSPSTQSSSALADRFDDTDGDEALALLASEVSLLQLKTDIRSEAQDFLGQFELSGSTTAVPVAVPALPPASEAEPVVVPASPSLVDEVPTQPADESEAGEGSHEGSHEGSLLQLNGDGRPDTRRRRLAEARGKITGL